MRFKAGLSQGGYAPAHLLNSTVYEIQVCGVTVHPMHCVCLNSTINVRTFVHCHLRITLLPIMSQSDLQGFNSTENRYPIEDICDHRSACPLDKRTNTPVITYILGVIGVLRLGV